MANGFGVEALNKTQAIDKHYQDIMGNHKLNAIIVMHTIVWT